MNAIDTSVRVRVAMLGVKIYSGARVHLRAAPALGGAASRGENRYPLWYVDWVGDLTGPGAHGHLGVSPCL